jgi:hypothetical protein
MSQVTDVLDDVTSRFLDHGFLLKFNIHFESTVYHSLVIGVFRKVNNGRLTISTARGRVRPSEKSPFNSLTPIWYRSVLKFFGYLLPVKSYSTFSICM